MPLRRHHDDDYWDKVTIQAATGANFVSFIRPRYKTSGLSGDEWRISAVVEVRRHPRNEPIATRTFHRMRNVLEYAAYFVFSNAPELFSSSSAAVLTVERKGHVLMCEERGTFGDAMIGLGWHILTANEGRDGVEWHHLTPEQEREHCQQVGCSAPPVVAYRLKKLQIGVDHHMIEPEYDFVGQYAWYCAQHAERGDCGLEDCDTNLETVPLESAS